MLSITSPEIKWEDVSGHIAYEGSDGVKNMVELTLMAIPDCRFTYHGGMKNGNDYVVEWTMSGTAFGQEFACRGASVCRHTPRSCGIRWRFAHATSPGSTV